MLFQLRNWAPPAGPGWVIVTTGPGGNATSGMLLQHNPHLAAAFNVDWHLGLPHAGTEEAGMDDGGDDDEGPGHELAASAHGLVNVIAWGLLMPLGVVAARHFKHEDPLWFHVHRSMQSVAFALGALGLASGLLLTADHAESPFPVHRNLGIALVVVASLQVLAIVARPDKDAKVRPLWNMAHWWTGRAVLLLAIVNIYEGLDAIGAGTLWTGAYTAALAAILITDLVLERQRLRAWLTEEPRSPLQLRAQSWAAAWWGYGRLAANVSTSHIDNTAAAELKSLQSGPLSSSLP
eukprot:SM000021S06472  [mRNA]  locus=s21:499980:501291:- [translate_table: standard]